MLKPRCSFTESTLAGTRAIVLDNGIFRLSVLPDFGGRICSLFYRPLNLELLATEFLHGKTNKLNVHGGWCAAFPSLLPDGELLSKAIWDTDVVEQSAEAIKLHLHCYIEQISHLIEGKQRVTPATIYIDRFISMSAGTPIIDFEDVLTNRNLWPMPVTWSGDISLRAQQGDKLVLPVEQVEVQRGVGPSGNELDFGLLVTTNYQALARNLSDGWIGFRPKTAPIDIRLTFSTDILPHAIIRAQRDEVSSEHGVFHVQPLATPAPIADSSRGGSLVLPSREPVNIALRLEVGSDIITASEWSRPGLQLAEMISNQRVPIARLAIWRVGEAAMVVKTPHQLVFIMPEFKDNSLIKPDDLPDADMILFDQEPERSMLKLLLQRTSARFVGPAGIRQILRTEGLNADRAITLSPGARVDLSGISVLATPAQLEGSGDRLGYMLQSDNLLLFHSGVTDIIGEFGTIGEQFHPQLLLLPLYGMTLANAIHSARQLQPRIVIPLGIPTTEKEFCRRCRDQHLSFATQTLSQSEGRLFDGWHLNPLA